VTADEAMAAGAPVTWQDYQETVRTARDEYLRAVGAARERRDTTAVLAYDEFTSVERTAWQRYHDTGHRAWLAYQDSQRTPPPPPATVAPDGLDRRKASQDTGQAGFPPPYPQFYPTPESER
jgi:hypothetical protein